MKTIHLFIAIIFMTSGLLVRGESENYSRQSLPPLMEFLDGRKVQTEADWNQRRNEIRSLLINYFIGTFPNEIPGLSKVQVTSERKHDDGSVRRRILLTWNTLNQATFEMALWTPKGSGPFPLLLTAPKDYQLLWAEDALSRGYAICLFPGVDSHHREQNYPGYESVWDKFRKEYPEASWTEISSKAWLASRCIDYLLSDQSATNIQSDNIAIIGFSRYGKQALIAAAFDERITCVVARSPGSPGSSPYRLTSRNTFAEAPSDFPSQWFLSSLRSYLGREDELPIDAHGWYALIAPRRCLIHTAYNDGAEPTFAVEKAYIEGRKVYQFLKADQNLRVDYRSGGHASQGPEKISTMDRQRNLDWIDLAFQRGTAKQNDFPVNLIHDFDWKKWYSEQHDIPKIRPDDSTTDKIHWLLGEKPRSIPNTKSETFLTEEESRLMTHDRWRPGGIQRVPVSFGNNVRGNVYFKKGLDEPAPVVIWLHPFSYHSGYNEGYGVEGTTVYNRLAQHGFIVIAYDQCGFGLRLLEGTTFYEDYPHWCRLGRMVHDVQSAIDFAVHGKGKIESAIPKLDSQKIYLLGYSAGALTALYTAALDDRIAGLACFSGWTPMKEDSNQELWEHHALLPRLGLYHENEHDLPLDYQDIILLAAKKPCLLVTPTRDRFANHKAITKTLAPLIASHQNISWLSPDDTNRFQSAQHQMFLDWFNELEDE